MSIFSAFDLHLFHEGTHQRLFDKFGARPWKQGEADGSYFALWAPGARHVSVVGSFNDWRSREDSLTQQVDPSIWEGFVPRARLGDRYRFYVEHGDLGAEIPDPFAFCRDEQQDASLICTPEAEWHEGAWALHKAGANSLQSPILICDGDARTAKQLGFTHVLLSAASGFAPAGVESRELTQAVGHLHQSGLGAALDFTAPHLSGGGPEGRSIAASAAVFWMETYHADLLIGRDLVRDDGWREDLYGYLSLDPIVRKHAHHALTRRIEWAWRENFVLPVHALPEGIPGTEADRAATARLMLAWMYAMPGKKMLKPQEQGALPLLTGQLNHLYRTCPALYSNDHNHEGFRWVENDAELNISSFLRVSADGNDHVLFIANFSPVTRANYRLGVSARGVWREVLNTDAAEYGGHGHGNFGAVDSVPIPLHGERYSVTVTVPPLGGVFFRWERP